MRHSKALFGVLATAIIIVPLLTVSPAYAENSDDLSADTTSSVDLATPEIPGTSLEDREATPDDAIPGEAPPGEPLPEPETVWTPPDEADDTAVPEDSNGPEQAWAPLPDTRWTGGGKTKSANRAPAGTVVGAPGLGELPWFAFQDFELSTDTTAQVNLANGNLLLKANDLVVRVPGYGLRHDRFYNGLSTVAGSLGGGWQTNNAEKDLGLTVTSTYVDFFGPNGLKLRFTKSGSTYTAPAGSNMTLKENPSLTTSRFVLTQNQTGEGFRFNPGGFLTRTLDRNNVGETYTYSSGKVTQVAHANGRAIILDRASSTSDTITAVRDSAGREVEYTYDSSNRLKTVTSTDGKVTMYTYDSTGRISTMIIPVAGAAGATTTVTFTYDSSHRVTKVAQESGINTTFAYTSGQTVVTDPNGNASTYAIDQSGKVSSATDALGNVRSQAWTANNDIASTTDALGTGITTYTYDGSNNRTAAQLPTGAAASAQYAVGTNCSAPNTGTAFQPKCSTDDAGNKKQYEYDSAGNPTKQSDTSGSSPVIEFERTYTGCGGYDGQVCTTKDGKGNTTTYAYNTKGDLTTVTPPSPMGATTYTYDSLGRVTSVKDGNGDTTTYQYDVRDRTVRTTYDNTATLVSTYYDNGLEKTRTDSAGGAKTFQYDPQGRITQETGPRSNVTMKYTYDKVGNLASYSGINPSQWLNELALDSYRLGYNAANQLTSVNQGENRACSSGNPDWSIEGCIQFERDANGAETKRLLPGRATIETARDIGGRPARITAKTGSGTTVVDIGYSYAASGSGADRGNIQTRTAYKEQGITAGAVTAYTYDSRNRLTKSEEKTGSTVSASWTNEFDANGNRTKLTRTGSTGITGNKTFTYNAANQLASSTGQTASWTYDAAGNQTRDGSGLVTSYGDRSQVTAIGSSQHSNFGTGNTDRYAVGSLRYDNGALGLMRRTNESTSNHTFTRTAEGTALGFKASDDAQLYYITDHLGSVVGMFDSNGDYLGGYSYSPDGEQRFTGTNGRVTGNQLRYIGELNVGGGLYKFGARYYDASQARFTQMDPSGQEQNPYAYGACNPVNASDPSGLNASWDCWRQAFALIEPWARLIFERNPAFALVLVYDGIITFIEEPKDEYGFLCEA